MRRLGMFRRIFATAVLLGMAAWPGASLTAAAVAPATPTTTPAAAATPESWTAAGSLQVARGFAPTVLLGDGTVITAGGRDEFSYFSSAERWSSSTGTWTAAGSIGHAAAGQVAAPLPGGKALFAGGTDGISYYGFGDVFDPTAGTWTQTPAMAGAHAYGAAASLASGDVLVISGYDGSLSITAPTVDVYSASAGTWSAGPPLPDGRGRFGLTATALADGRILVVGGDDGSLGTGSTLATVYVYASDSGWTAAESMKEARFDHAAVRLADGRVLVAGGSNVYGTALPRAELYDPATGLWTNTGPMVEARLGLTLTLLPDGRVLAAGGYANDANAALLTAEIYDPTTGGWSPTAPMSAGRRLFSATALPDGRVLAVGGHGVEGEVYLASAEVYTPPNARKIYPASTFHPIAPARILDTRYASGLTGPFYNQSPRLFQVTGKGNVPSNAIAVTGILTATVMTRGGYVSLGPAVSSTPGSSTLNFPMSDNRANNVAVALNEVGQLSAVYVAGGSSGSTHLLFDVTGYFTADDSGATFVGIEPGRILDSRYGTGLGGKFATGAVRTFQVTGLVGVPAEAVAVTGNLTLVKPTGKGWALIGPSIPANPTTICCSTVNAPAGDVRADGVTVQLGTGGTLSAVWVGPKGSTADLVFDVTGYFVNGLSGARFVPIDPTRLVDTRSGLPLQGPLASGTRTTVPITLRGGVPGSAVAISGNLTVVNQTNPGYATISPTIGGSTTPTSTLNFPRGDIRANGFYVRLSPTGTVDLLYYSTVTSASTHLVVDVTGYFTP